MTDTSTERDAETIWTRLRRRKVVQWGIGYVAGAWGLLQGLGYLSGVFDWPRPLQQYTTLALVIGLPIILVLAWYHGDRGEQRVKGAELGIIALLFLAGGAILWRYNPSRDAPAAVSNSPTPAAATIATSRIEPAALNEKSIAVLPFVDMSQAKDQEYFADGVSEEVLNLLARLPDLKVIARTSSFAYKGKDTKIADIARELGVAHVLEGSVRQAGNKVRITAQLIHAADSTQVWSETYSRTLDDVFAVQDDIAVQVVKALEITLLESDRPTNMQVPQAYNLLLQAQFLWHLNTEKDTERAIEYLHRALEIDPDYAPAWAALASAYSRQADNVWTPTDDGYRLARAAAKKAISLDPQLADAHRAMGWIQYAHDWDWTAADASFRRALALEPSNAEVLRQTGFLAGTLGRWDDAIALTAKANELDPLRPAALASLVYLLLNTDRAQEAEAVARRALELTPNAAGRHVAIGHTLLAQRRTQSAFDEAQLETDEPWRWYLLALVYHALGRSGEADATLESLQNKYADDMAFQIAEIHAVRGEADLAFEWLDRAYARRDPGVTRIMGSRYFRTLADDPRYTEFLRKLKLAT